MRRVSLEVRAPDAELMVDDRRVDEDEELLAARRAAPVDELERLLGEPLGELARVRDRRRRAEEHRVRPVVAADAPQPPQHVAEVAAEHAAIGVQLVDDDVAQVLEQLRPARVVRQDARVQHVGIAEHQVRARPNRPPRVLRRVAVVGEHADLRSAREPCERLAQSPAARRADPARAPWSETDRARGSTDPAGSSAGPARCSRASCPSGRRDRRRRGGRRARARSLRPDACRAVRCRATRAPPGDGRRARRETARIGPQPAGSRRTAVTCRSGVSGRSIGETPRREPFERRLERAVAARSVVS